MHFAEKKERRNLFRKQKETLDLQRAVSCRSCRCRSVSHTCAHAIFCNDCNNWQKWLVQDCREEEEERKLALQKICRADFFFCTVQRASHKHEETGACGRHDDRQQHVVNEVASDRHDAGQGLGQCSSLKRATSAKVPRVFRSPSCGPQAARLSVVHCSTSSAVNTPR